jgi:hypothetical protein
MKTRYDKDARNPVYYSFKVPAKIKAGPRREYGLYVLARIREFQASALESFCKRGYAHPCPCASKTYHSGADEILAAVSAQNRAGVGR